MKDQICSSAFKQINRQAILWTWIEHEERADKRVGGTGQNRDRTLQSSQVSRNRLRSRPAKSPAELVDRPGGCQPGQQCRKNPHALTPAKLKCRNKSFLETVGSICVVTRQPVRSLPDNRSVFFDNYLPVNHLQAPSETLFYPPGLSSNFKRQAKLLSSPPMTGRRYISRRFRLFYYNNSQFSTLACRMSVVCREKNYILFNLLKFFLAKIFSLYQNGIVSMAKDRNSQRGGP